MFWKKKRINKYDDDISVLADMLICGAEPATFKMKAKEFSNKLNADDILELKKLFHNPPPESPNYDPKKHGLGSWMSACQFAIFELYYCKGLEALPLVREVAWGEYDWTQGNAIELLIRFASQGIDREQLIEEIKQNYPKIRYEAQLYSIQPLIGELEKDESLKSVFNELMTIEDFKESYKELTE